MTKRLVKTHIQNVQQVHEAHKAVAPTTNFGTVIILVCVAIGGLYYGSTSTKAVLNAPQIQAKFVQDCLVYGALGIVILACLYSIMTVKSKYNQAIAFSDFTGSLFDNDGD